MAANSKARMAPWKLLKNKVRSRRPESCTVYGAGADAMTFLKTLGRDGICGGVSHLYHTKYHAVMMENDAETLLFYQQHLQDVQEGKIILALKDDTNFDAPSADVHSVCTTDVTAAMFWRNYPALPNDKIAFLGDAALIRFLLCKGLCLNLYAAVQCIEYHVWSTFDFCSTGLEQITMDKILLHHHPWQEEIRVLMGMHCIVLCFGDEENSMALAQLCSLSSCPTIYVHHGKNLPMGAAKR